MEATITYQPELGWLAEIDFNQCDGCQARLALKPGYFEGDWIHVIPPPAWPMGCDAVRYPLPISSTKESVELAREWIEDKVGCELLWSSQDQGRRWAARQAQGLQPHPTY